MPVPRALVLLLAAALAACNGDSCRQEDAEIGYACVPDTVAADVKVVIEVREACGTYCAKDPSCTAQLRGGAVVLEFVHDVCGDVNPLACAGQSCTQRIATCALPHLREGDYTLVVPGSPDRLLRVRAGGDASCHIAANAP